MLNKVTPAFKRFQNVGVRGNSILAQLTWKTQMTKEKQEKDVDMLIQNPELRSVEERQASGFRSGTS